MTHKRIVILLNGLDSALADWVCLSETGDITQTVLDGQLKSLTLLIKETDVTVIVPAQDVLLTEATLPKLSRQRMLQALPYALEEQLINDVGDLHFAIGEYQPDGTLPVAVVAKDKMQHWIHILKEAGIEPVAFIPATLAVPFNENQLRIYSYNNLNIVRTGKYTGFTADNTSLAKMLELSNLTMSTDNALTSTSTTINASIPKTKSDTHHHAVSPAKPITYDDITKKSLLEKIALTLTSTPFINLLQRPYVAKRKTTRTKNVWKYAAYIAIAWVAISFFNNFVSFIILHHQSNAIEAQINEIYTRNFPQAKSVSAPRERMETKLKETISATQKNNFLSLLATVGKALSTTHGIRLQNLTYRNGQLTLEVSSANFDNLDTLTRDLNAKGLTVKQQNSATAGSQVKATLLINAGTS
jgi:general secretion pathway protein L